MLDFETSKSSSEVLNFKYFRKKNFCLENDFTLEGAVSHNVLYYKHLFIDR